MIVAPRFLDSLRKAFIRGGDFRPTFGRVEAMVRVPHITDNDRRLGWIPFPSGLASSEGSIRILHSGP